MRVDQTCPLCRAPAKVTGIGAFGWHASCSSCYDEDPAGASWSHLQGVGETPDAAVERWLDDARECAAIDEIPGIQCSYRPVSLFAEIERQALAEFERQKGFELVEGWQRYVEDDGTRVDQDIIYLELPCACG